MRKIGSIDPSFERLVEFAKIDSWQFNHGLLTLTTFQGGYPYEIDLETCTSSAKILDWIFQIESKTWCTPELLHDLIRIFRIILDPQGNHCSGGIERFEGKSVLKTIRDRIKP